MKVNSSDGLATALMLLAGAAAGLFAVFAMAAGDKRGSAPSGERVNVDGMDRRAQKLLAFDPARLN